MRGWDYHPTVGLVLSGGVECRGCGIECRICESIAGVERTTDSGSTFEELKSWGPWGLYQHCLKIVDEDRLFVAGGINRVGGGDKMREASMTISRSRKILTKQDGVWWAALFTVFTQAFLAICKKLSRISSRIKPGKDSSFLEDV